MTHTDMAGLIARFPLLERLMALDPLTWFNPGATTLAEGLPHVGLTRQDVAEAAARLTRFAPCLCEAFPETRASKGILESEIAAIPAMQATLNQRYGVELTGRLLLKKDSHLPISGSIKARGGIHEVLEFAEALALQHGLLTSGGDYRQLATPQARALLGRYQVAVGSTGNLGLSIGVAASALGFRAVVHMSLEAKEWKKERLRQRGVQVVEHAGDYEQAVAVGRAQAASDPFCHFVDDERSLSLLQGYSAAAPALQRQLAAAGITVDATHPLFVYLPCGVGGAPAGITFGLRQLLGPQVHCFFAEPVQSPCFLAQMLAGPHDHPSVYDWGLTNQTEADGLAVPRASLLAASLMHPLLSGIFTVQDATLFQHLAWAHDTEGLRIEPSAAAGFSGPAMLTGTLAGRAWLRAQGLEAHLPRATHLAWTTGGLFVPEAEYDLFLQRGRAQPQAASA